MKVFVSGATGFQGANIAQHLIGNGHEVSTLSRATGDERPTVPNLQILSGDLADQSTIATALQGADAAVYTVPLSFDLELAKNYTTNFIEAAKSQNIGLVVFNAGFDLPASNTGLLALDLKVAVKELLDASGLNVITLMPDVYIDNLAAPWSIPVILNNAILPYPVAAGAKIPWISHVDLAKYVGAALQHPELAGQVLPIGGKLLTGEEIAAAIAAKIGSPVNFVPVTPDDFEQQLAPMFGEVAAREISNLYRYVEQNHSAFISKEFKQSQELLSVTPQTLEEWVASVKWEA